MSHKVTGDRFQSWCKVIEAKNLDKFNSLSYKKRLVLSSFIFDAFTPFILLHFKDEKVGLIPVLTG